MRYAELASTAQTAFQHAIDTFSGAPLPSEWGPPAVGWHELHNAERAGVYASCDGLILLASPRYSPGPEVPSLFETVYYKHVRPMFDESAAAPDGLMHQQILLQKHKALNISFKLARFLEASNYIPGAASDPVVQFALDRLCAMHDSNTGLFTKTPNGEQSLAATALAVKALLPFRELYPDAVFSSLKTLRASLHQYATHGQFEPGHDLVATIWTCSQLEPGVDDETGHAAALSIERALSYHRPTPNWISPTEHIWSGDIRDRLEVNAGLLLGAAIPFAVNNRHLHDSYLRHVVPLTLQIIECIQQHGFYSRTGEDKCFRFWEQRFALTALEAFIPVSESKPIAERTIMIVHPKLFNDHDFTVEPNSGVVIMPFTMPESSDVYRIMQEAAGDTTLWRADDSFEDEAIIQSVWSMINKANFVIADCTGRNPNVFYELGIAHTLGKPVLLCAQDHEDFPFDIQHIRRFTYGLMPSEVETFKTVISRFVDSLKRPGPADSLR